MIKDSDFLDYLNQAHGVELDQDDLDCLRAHQAALEQRRQRDDYYLQQDPLAWMTRHDLESGRVLRVAAATAAGAFSGGAGFSLLGAAIGFAGGLINALLTPKAREQREDEKFDQSFGIESGGKLAPYGTPMPMIYGNRNVTLNNGQEIGGVRVGGILINSRIDTKLGTNQLYQLYALSLGQSGLLGYGQLGQIDDAATLFNKQPYSNFTQNEIETWTREGFRNQTAIAAFPRYSQVHTPPDYAVFGVDLRGEVGQSQVIPDQDDYDGIVNVAITGGTITKNAGGPGWNAGAFSQIGINAGGFVEWVGGNPTDIKAAGLSNTDPDQSWVSIEHGFYWDGSGNVFVVEGGVIVAGPIAAAAGDVFRVQVTPGGGIQYLINGVVVYTSALIPALPLFADIAINTPGGGFTGLVTSSQPGGIPPGGGTTTVFSLQDTDDHELFDPAEDYTLCDGLIPGGSSIFNIVAKDPTNHTITTDGPITLADGAGIYAYWIAKWENTTRVNRTTFNLIMRVSSREGDRDDDRYGELKTHTVAFDLWMRPVTAPLGSEVFVIRMVVRSKNPSDIRRWFGTIVDLGRYYHEIRPLCSLPCDQPVYELTDSGDCTVIDTGVVLVPGAAPVQIEGEFLQVAGPGAQGACDTLNGEMSYDDKQQVTSEQGPTGRIGSINEQQDPAAINVPSDGLPNRYPGIALQGVRYTGSERLRQPPGLRTLVREGRVAPNLMAAGEAGMLSGASTLNDPTADFITDDIQVGWIVRNTSLDPCFAIAIANEPTFSTPDGHEYAVGDYIDVYTSDVDNPDAMIYLGRRLVTAVTATGYTATFVSGTIIPLGIQVFTIIAKTAQITAISPTSVTTDIPLSWAEKSEYVIYFLQALCRLPDVFADVLANDYGGLRAIIDPDEYVHYPSLVESRKFCVENEYFWNGIIEDPVPFQQWGTEEAKQSRLLPYRENGRYGLIPDRLTPIDLVLNTSTDEKVEQTRADWQESAYNKMVVRYIDGRDVFTQDGARFRKKTIQIWTPEAYNGLEEVREHPPLDLDHVNHPEQAIDIGTTILKSKRLQRLGVTLRTGYEAAYLQAGRMIHLMDNALVCGEEYSGFVVEADPLVGTVQSVRLDCPPKLAKGYATAAAVNGLISDEADFLEAMTTPGDLLVNLDTGDSAIVQGVTENRINAAIEFSEEDCYCVLNLTPPVDMLISAMYRADGSTIENLSFTFEQRADNQIWLRITGLTQPLAVRDPVNVGGTSALFRVQSVRADGKAAFSVSATYHPGEELYLWKQADNPKYPLIVEYDDITLT